MSDSSKSQRKYLLQSSVKTTIKILMIHFMAMFHFQFSNIKQKLKNQSNSLRKIRIQKINQFQKKVQLNLYEVKVSVKKKMKKKMKS